MKLNRFVTWIKPYINLLAAGIATWLVAKVNVLGLPGLDQANTATWIAGALTFGLTSLMTQLGDIKWLHGHYIDMDNQAALQTAAIEAQKDVAQPTGEGVDPEHDELMELDEELPDDDEEFASPPPDETNTPVQPSQVGLTDPEIKP